MTPSVEIVEVSARDGLQNESVLLSTAQKVELIHRSVAAGVRRIEVASFVHPKRVPQMADVPPTEVLFADTVDVLGPRGAKSMSEAPYNPVAPALANAVRDAVGVRPYELPMSRDRIWRLLNPGREVRHDV